MRWIVFRRLCGEGGLEDPGGSGRAGGGYFFSAVHGRRIYEQCLGCQQYAGIAGILLYSVL